MLDDIFLVVLNMSLTASVAAALIVLTRWVIGRRLPRIFSYALWVIVLLRMAIPFSLSSVLSIYNVIPLPDTIMSDSQKYQGINNSIPYNNDSVRISQEKAVNIVSNNGTINSLSSANLVSNNTMQKVTYFFAWTCLIGMTGILLLSIHAYLKVSGKLKDAVIYKSSDLVSQLSHKLKIKREVKIYISDRIQTPVVHGFFNVRIILPLSLSSDCNDSELNHIIAHELIHIKRYDHIMKPITLLALCVHWFNPLMWISFILCQKDMEMSCDEKVMSVFDNDIRSEYAASLIKLAEKQNILLNGGLLAFGESNIKSRIKGIMSFKKPGFWIGTLTIVILVYFCLALLTNAQYKAASRDNSAYDGKNTAVQSGVSTFLLKAYPEKYALTLSSTPGIRILAQYEGTADKVEYSTTRGTLLTWDSTSGKIYDYGQTVELQLNTPVYWSPLASGEIKDTDFFVKAVIFNKNDRLIEKQVNIKYDSTNYLYIVIPSSDVIIDNSFNVQLPISKTVEEEVSRAIKAQAKGYMRGEVSTEGHIILDIEENAGKAKVYTSASIGNFGFENGIFTKVSGSGAIPTVMTFLKNDKGEYSLIEYKEAMDGNGYSESVKKMFPQKLWDKVLSDQKYYPELVKQQEEQAKQYLNSIGRNAKVSEAHVEKKLPQINVEASNKLLSMKELGEFPYWLGTREQIEQGVRYVYEKTQSQSSDGFNLIIYKKMRDDGTVVKEYKYKIVGNEPQLVN